MNEARILKGLLWIIQEADGLGPADLEKWIGKLQKAGYIKTEQRKVDGFQLPYWAITEEGKAKL